MSHPRVGFHSFLTIVMGGIVLLQVLHAEPQSFKYTLTIYVDEGHGKLTGHVFVELSNGRHALYRGFYPNEAVTDTFTKAPALFGLAGGQVRDDSQHPSNVERTYNITKDGYENAVRTIVAASQQGKGVAAHVSLWGFCGKHC